MASPGVITIVVVTDEHYIILLAALLKSVEQNHKTPEKLNVFIIEDGVEENSKTRLRDSVNADIITLNWVKMKDAIPAAIKLPADRTTFPLNIYLRLFIADIVAPGTSKALFLDADMLVLRDISELWYTDLQNNTVAAVQDERLVTFDNAWGGILNYRELGFKPNTPYFNTGLLLIDIPKWTQQSVAESVIACVKNNVRYANYPDQYGLNIVLANRWLKLDGRWNYFATGSIKEPYIIHFISRKPIYKSYAHNMQYKELFDHYLSLTQWSNAKLVSEISRYAKKLNNVFTKLTAGNV